MSAGEDLKKNAQTQREIQSEATQWILQISFATF